MATRTIKVQESSLEELLSWVEAGDDVVLLKEGVPLAHVSPLRGAGVQRKAGLHRGAIRTSQDFDAPLPEAFWTEGA